MFRIGKDVIAGGMMPDFGSDDETMSPTSTTSSARGGFTMQNATPTSAPARDTHNTTSTSIAKRNMSFFIESTAGGASLSVMPLTPDSVGKHAPLGDLLITIPPDLHEAITKINDDAANSRSASRQDRRRLSSSESVASGSASVDAGSLIAAKPQGFSPEQLYKMQEAGQLRVMLSLQSATSSPSASPRSFQYPPALARVSPPTVARSLGTSSVTNSVPSSPSAMSSSRLRAVACPTTASSPVADAAAAHTSSGATMGFTGRDLGLAIDAGVLVPGAADLRCFEESSDNDDALPRETPEAAGLHTAAQATHQPDVGLVVAAPDIVISPEGMLELRGFHVHETGMVHAPATPLAYGDAVPQELRSLTGINFKDYSVRIEFLGKGASGTVFKMVHVPTLTIVAAKSIPIYDVARRHSMASELAALHANFSPFPSAALSPPPSAPCPYIVSFYDAFVNTKEDSLTFVMEYMDGGSLQDIVDTGGCHSESVLANIAWRILQGLKFLHDRNIIHRDIKPSNVLINHMGEVKLTDFGIIREMDEGADFAKTFVGTFTYMSPERIAGKEYAYASDVWSFGLSILACAVGKYPFASTPSFWALMDKLESEDPPLPPEHFSDEFRSFINDCLTRNPHMRPSVDTLLQHQFLARVRRKDIGKHSAVPDVSQAENAGSLHELKEIARNVQEYRFLCACKSREAVLPIIPTDQFAHLASQMGIPETTVTKYFGKFQRQFEKMLAERAARKASRSGRRSHSARRSAPIASGAT